MYKNFVSNRLKGVMKRAAGAVLGAAVLLTAIFILQMNDFQKDPTHTGSVCNKKMTAAINNAYGTNAGNDIIARMAEGDEKSAYVSIWSNGWTKVYVESCDKVQTEHEYTKENLKKN